jgi:glutamate N-acetyltransferase / amino-acid N-acetyltransferase
MYQCAAFSAPLFTFGSRGSRWQSRGFNIHHRISSLSMTMTDSESKVTRVANGGITAARGFRAAGATAGFKPSGLPDLAVILTDDPVSAPATGAAVFTKSHVRAAPVDLSESHFNASNGRIAAIVVNSGQANAATGSGGEADAIQTAELAASTLGCDVEQILVASTGMIGVRFDVDLMANALPSLIRNTLKDPPSSDAIAGANAATAIMTTDLKRKEAAFEAFINGKQVRVGGMAKGSGMIHPNMATLLGFVTCDALVDQKLWQEMLRRATDKSFNMITVDGDTSTNDILFAMCNGSSGICISDGSSMEAALVERMLTQTCTDLAKQIARDGEGATVLVEVRTTGASTDSDARAVARTVAGSNLLKAAIFGRDPNWGRIAAAAGRAGIPFSSSQLSVRLGPHTLVERGEPVAFSKEDASAYLTAKAAAASEDYCSDEDTVVIEVCIGDGPGEGVAWGCDLSYKYVEINSEYST